MRRASCGHEKTGQHFYDADLHRLKGEITLVDSQQSSVWLDGEVGNATPTAALNVSSTRTKRALC